MTIDEAIIDCREVAEIHEQKMKQCDSASGFTRSHNASIRTTDAKRHEVKAKEYYQIAEWLKDYKRLKEQEPIESVLDDIKAEIKRKTNSGQWSDAVIFGMQKALAIIDKYKAENELLKNI